jgi:hypothetical protein
VGADVVVHKARPKEREASVTNVITYDNRFNANEWFVILGLCAGIIALFVLPRRFPNRLFVLYFMCGVTFGAFFDLTLGEIPVSFYNVGDTSNYETFDFLSIVMYGPYSYVFFYVYDFLKLNQKINSKFIPLYIFIWTLLSLGIEWCGVQLGVFHYHHGYGIQVSFVIYLLVHSGWVLFFHLVKPETTQY